MRKTFIAFLLLAVGTLTVTSGFDITDNSGQAGRTGSPGESTCNVTCHTGFALNDGTGSITISSPDMPTWEYMPGDTYTIDVTVSRAGNSLFGVDVECLTGSSPAQNAGVLVITNSAQTQIKNNIVSSVTRHNVVHKLNGGTGTDSHTFSFKWVCPTTNVGNVTFYATGNAANGNNLTSGDHIYKLTQVVTPALGAGMNAAEENPAAFNIYPNPATDHLSVSFDAKAGEDYSVHLISADGKEVAQLGTGITTGDPIEISASLPADLKPGLYLVQLVHGYSFTAKKILVQ
jgi:methionine-rich copper-binding protein CopC